jgi:hypothetical protein
MRLSKSRMDETDESNKSILQTRMMATGEFKAKKTIGSTTTIRQQSHCTRASDPPFASCRHWDGIRLRRTART